MSKQEVEFETVIALDTFRAGGEQVEINEKYRASKNTAKQLVSIGMARYATPEDDDPAGADKAAADKAAAEQAEKEAAEKAAADKAAAEKAAADKAAADKSKSTAK